MRKLFLITVFFTLIAPAAFSARWLLSEIYLRAANAPQSPSTTVLAASQHSITLAPWRIKPYKRLARALVSSGRPLEEVRATYVAALTWAPSDAYLWQDFSQILAYQGQMDSSFDFAIQRAQRLAPASPTLHTYNVVLGMQYWLRGSSAAQGVWLNSMRYVLHRSPKKFLKYIYSSGQMYWFCNSPALELPVKKWCDILWANKDIRLILSGGKR